MKDVTAAKAGHVFVATYGSLRRDMENFRVNAHGDGEYFGHGRTVDDFNLYVYGSSYFPSVSLKHNSHGNPVVVDIFEVPEDGLTGAYDMLEGHNPNHPESGFYNRTEIPVDLDDGRTVIAWIYHIDEEQRTPVEHGDWCIHKRGDNYYANLSE